MRSQHPPSPASPGPHASILTLFGARDWFVGGRWAEGGGIFGILWGQALSLRLERVTVNPGVDLKPSDLTFCEKGPDTLHQIRHLHAVRSSLQTFLKHLGVKRHGEMPLVHLTSRNGLSQGVLKAQRPRSCSETQEG